MKPFAFLAAAAACALAGAAVAQPGPPPPYNDVPATYPWRNGPIDGPSGSGPYGGGFGGFGGYGGYGGGGGFGGGGGYGGYAGYGYGGYVAGPGWGGGPQGPGFAGGGYGGPGLGPGGAPAVFPLPDNGGYAVGQNPDGSLSVIRYGPVWTSQVGPDGWSHRHYIRYGFFPFSGIWPFN